MIVCTTLRLQTASLIVTPDNGHYEIINLLMGCVVPAAVDHNRGIRGGRRGGRGEGGGHFSPPQLVALPLHKPRRGKKRVVPASRSPRTLVRDSPDPSLPPLRYYDSSCIDEPKPRLSLVIRATYHYGITWGVTSATPDICATNNGQRNICFAPSRPRRALVCFFFFFFFLFIFILLRPYIGTKGFRVRMTEADK